MTKSPDIEGWRLKFLNGHNQARHSDTELFRRLGPLLATYKGATKDFSAEVALAVELTAYDLYRLIARNKIIGLYDQTYAARVALTALFQAGEKTLDRDDRPETVRHLMTPFLHLNDRFAANVCYHANMMWEPGNHAAFLQQLASGQPEKGLVANATYRTLTRAAANRIANSASAASILDDRNINQTLALGLGH